MQRAKWELEYQKRKDLPSSRTDKPSRALLDFLETHHLLDGEVLDIGSGNGRNAIYLGKQGRQVTGIEIATTAIQEAKVRAKESGLNANIDFLEFSAGEEHWPFVDNQFALALDMMVLHVLDKKERENYARELVRVLKPGGFFVFHTIASDSPAAQELFKTSPGSEPNSYIIPQSGMVEKTFTREELESLFAPLTIESFERKTEFTHAFDGVYEIVYYSGVMKKDE